MSPDDAATSLHATVLLEKSRGRVGADRLDLLRAIAATGSISGAARASGLSYKAAWDAVQVLNNLFDRPLVITSAGGSAGGTSVVTEAGAAVIAALTTAELELTAVTARLETALAGGGRGGGARSLIWGIAMKTSARNALRGTVVRVTSGAVETEVALDVGNGVEIVATITRASADDLGLRPGKAAIALIKASFVILAAGNEPIRTSARNAIAGFVARREDDGIISEVTLDIADGKTLTATLTRTSADALGLRAGAPATAMIKASHVILAIA